MAGRAGMKRISVGAVLALAFMVSGCGQDTATAPQVNTFSGQPILLPENERPDRTAFLADQMPSVTTTVSAALGGTVSMGRYTLEFPAGALSADTEITIRQSDAAAMVIELEPHGIQFNRPVTLTGTVGDLVSGSAKSVGVAWMNDATGQWEVVGETAGNSWRSSANLWHFSEYEFWSE